MLCCSRAMISNWFCVVSMTVQTHLASFDFGVAVLHFPESPNVTCVQWNRFWLLSGPLEHHSSKACVFAKRSLCASRSFPTVETADDAVATELLRGPCRSSNVTCVRSNRFGSSQTSLLWILPFRETLRGRSQRFSGDRFARQLSRVPLLVPLECHQTQHT